MQGSSGSIRHGVTRKRRKNESRRGELFWKEPKEKICLLTLDLKLFRS